MRKLLLSLTLSISLVAFPLQRSISAMSPEQRKLYQQSVYAFDIDVESPCGFNGANTGTGNTSNSASAAQKIWDFFISKGLTPVATAGILGNFHEESGLDPAIKQNHTLSAIPAEGDGVTGFGIAQWTSKGRQAGLFAKMQEAGLSKYHGAGFGHPDINKTEIPSQDLDKLLMTELEYAWSGDTTTIESIAEQLNKAVFVGGEDGSAIIFHRLYERSADNVSQIAERVDSASDYLNLLRKNNGACKPGELGGVSSKEDALAWAMRFVEDTRAKYNPGGNSLNNKENPDGSISVWFTNDRPVGGASGCWGAHYCGQCTALSGWFVTNMTEYAYGAGHGGQVVSRLKAKGVETGTEPRPFSVFSTSSTGGIHGHTGVVLGVLSENEVIALENNNGKNILKIYQYDIKKEYPDATFAYVGDKLKVPELLDAQRLGGTLEQFE